MAIYNKRAKFTREQLLDHYLKRNSITDLLYTIVRVLGIIVQNLYCISSYLIITWLVLLPVNWLKSDLYSRLENYLYNSLVFIVSSWSLAAGVTIVESGDEFKHLIEEPEKYYPDDNTRRKNETELLQQHYRPGNRQSLSSSIDKKVTTGNTTKRYLDDLLNRRDHHNHNQTSNGLNSTENCIKSRQLVNGDIKVAHHESNGLSDGARRNSHLNGLASEIKAKTDNNSRILLGDTNDVGSTELIENHRNVNERKNDYMKTAEMRLVNHNNNNITSENNHITAKKFNHHCNGVVKHDVRELALSARALNNSNVHQDTLKNNQARPRILFLCNHISTADVPLIMQSFSTLTRQSILWVLDAQFKVTNFGVVCGSHGDFFVAKNTFHDGSLREHVLKFADRNLLVLFPEGGFLRKRIDGSNRYATKNHLPMTKYVTHPRFGAFKDLIDPSVGVTHIVDATLMYDNIKNPLSILDIVFGNKKEPAILHYNVYKRSEINPTEEWLRNIWLEKDKLLTRYYEDRASVLEKIDGTFRVARLDWFKILSVHLFFFLVCYLTMFRLFNATSVTMLKARELYYSNI